MLNIMNYDDFLMNWLLTVSVSDEIKQFFLRYMKLACSLMMAFVYHLYQDRCLTVIC